MVLFPVSGALLPAWVPGCHLGEACGDAGGGFPDPLQACSGKSLSLGSIKLVGAAVGRGAALGFPMRTVLTRWEGGGGSAECPSGRFPAPFGRAWKHAGAL